MRKAWFYSIIAALAVCSWFYFGKKPFENKSGIENVESNQVDAHRAVQQADQRPSATLIEAPSPTPPQAADAAAPTPNFVPENKVERDRRGVTTAEQQVASIAQPAYVPRADLVDLPRNQLLSDIANGAIVEVIAEHKIRPHQVRQWFKNGTFTAGQYHTDDSIHWDPVSFDYRNAMSDGPHKIWCELLMRKSLRTETSLEPGTLLKIADKQVLLDRAGQQIKLMFADDSPIHSVMCVSAANEQHIITVENLEQGAGGWFKVRVQATPAPGT